MNKVKNKLEGLGWKFQERIDVNYHNGNKDIVYSFKSPRMKGFADSCKGALEYGAWNEKELLKEEVFSLARTKLYKIEDYGGLLEKLKDEAQKILVKLYKENESFEYTDKEILEMALSKLK